MFASVVLVVVVVLVLVVVGLVVVLVAVVAVFVRVVVLVTGVLILLFAVFFCVFFWSNIGLLYVCLFKPCKRRDRLAFIMTLTKWTGQGGKAQYYQRVGVNVVIDDNANICKECLEKGTLVLPIVNHREDHGWYSALGGRPFMNLRSAIEALMSAGNIDACHIFQ